MPVSPKALMPLALAALLTSVSMHAQANNTIYTCKGPNGKISLQQGPCPGDAKQDVQTVRPAPSLNADARKPSSTPKK